MNDIKHSKSFIAQKCYSFALEIISGYKNLIANRKEYVLSKQLLRSGTSIGANVNEALSAESKKDFIHKLSIALKEAKETYYWLNLLSDSDYLPPSLFNKLGEDCMQIIRILTSIIMTTKTKYFTNTNS